MTLRIPIKPGMALMEHQVRALKFKLKWPIGADYSEVGVGKTASMLLALQARRLLGHSKRILWVTTDTMKEETAPEVVKWTDMKPTVLHDDSRTRAGVLAEAIKTGECFILVNYESLRLIQDELERARFDSIVCDEGSAVKNPESQRSKALYAISKWAKFRWLMTGTPVPNTVVDVFGHWKFIEPTLFETLRAFKNEYCIYKKQGAFPIIIGYQKLDQLQSVLAERSIRFLRDECFQLPGRIFRKREISFGDVQRKAYRELKEEFLLSLGEGRHVETKTVLDAIVKLSQLTSGFVIDADGNVVELAENAKLTELKQVVDECDLRSTKIIIWCYFRHSMAKLVEVFKEYNPAQVHGEIKGTDRSEELEKFRKDPTCRILVANIATGQGYTVNEAKVSIYYELDHSWEHRDQSLGRNYRYGQTEKVVVYDLTVRGTVDVAKLAALANKKNVQDMVTGDNLRKLFEGAV